MRPEADQRKKLTFRYEKFRAPFAGIVETAGTTFILLIAVRHYQAGSMTKALLAGAMYGGLLVSPLLVSLVTSLGWRIATASAVMAIVGGAGLLAAALFPVLPVFVVGSMIGLSCFTLSIPLLTQIYQDNYPSTERGVLFARTMMIRIVAAVAFAELAGRALSTDFDRFPWLLLAFSLALFAGAYCLFQYPSRPLPREGGIQWLRAFGTLREDAVFRRTLTSWMTMGFANLMMLPLRVEYLANPRYGLAFSAAAVALLTSVVPNAVRLGAVWIWGRLFDEINFFLLRIVLNLCFVVAIATFFWSSSMGGFLVGAAVFGLSRAGGEVAWSLWVTKIAPPDRVAEYMAVHTSTNGVRGLLAPVAGFYLVNHIAIPHLATIAVVTILIASIMLVPDARLGRRRRSATPLVEEVSE